MHAAVSTLTRVLAVALLCSGMAQAAPTVYAGLDNQNLAGGGPRPNSSAAHNAFVTAAGPLAQQGFEAAEGFATGAVPGSFAVGSVGVSFTNQASNYSQISSGIGSFNTYATEGSQHLESLTDAGTNFYSMDFDAGVHALGFFLSDPSDWIGATGPLPGLQLTLFRAGGGSTVLELLPGIDVSTLVDGNLAFFGVVDSSEAILGFSISNPLVLSGADALGLDQLLLGQAAHAVPVPASLSLALGAALAACGARRRKST